MIGPNKSPQEPAKSYFVENIVDPIGRKLDASPPIHKVVVFVAHLFRMLASLALLSFLPFSFAINCLITLAGSLFYRVAIERICAFHFAIPDCLGAMALALFLPYLINMTAISTFSMLAETFAHLVPFAIYLGVTVWLSHSEVEERSTLLNLQKPKPKSCCS